MTEVKVSTPAGVYELELMPGEPVWQSRELGERVPAYVTPDGFVTKCFCFGVLVGEILRDFRPARHTAEVLVYATESKVLL